MQAYSDGVHELCVINVRVRATHKSFMYYTFMKTFMYGMQAYPFVVRKVLRNSTSGSALLLRDLMYDSNGNVKPTRLSALLNAALGYVADQTEGFIDFDAVPAEGASKQVRHLFAISANAFCANAVCASGAALLVVLDAPPAEGAFIQVRPFCLVCEAH